MWGINPTQREIEDRKRIEADNEANEMSEEMMSMMVEDYMFDHYDTMEGCELEGKPYLSELTGHWTQDARDEYGKLFFLYAYGGNIYVA